MSTYWTYYLAWTFLAYAMRQPLLLVGVVIFLILKKFIPDPGAIFRALRRTSALRAQVGVNAANITARRDLALIHLDLRRPGSALKLADEALARSPDDAELLYIRGLALHRVGRHEEALAPLIRTVALDPRLRFGLPYMAAGDALFALDRTEEALDAYQRYADTNSSDVTAFVRLTRAYARVGERDAAQRAVQNATQTYSVLPMHLKRRQFVNGYLAAQWARIWVLRQPAAIAVALILVTVTSVAIRAVYPAAAQWFHRAAHRSTAPAALDDE